MRSNSTFVILACFFAFAGAFHTSTTTKLWKSSLYAGFGKLPPKDEMVNVVVDGTSKCLCGSDVVYQHCCKPYHENKVNDPESLIRSRYSAYASSNIDFIISSTSEVSSDYRSFIETPVAPANGLKRWAKSIRSNMLDEFRYVRMEIDAVSYSGDEAALVSWCHLAIRKADNVMYPIAETSTIVKAKGVWSYVSGVVSRPSTEASQTMMNDWPTLMGLELKFDGENFEDGAAANKVTPGAKRPMMDYEGSKKFKSK
mmetsp:Transcript_30663/g.29274  ORF Transcript_30663/g.29274 Transcript_30663/m.29274 type:complete len:256 (-) Transcript_30663:286-1053(-)|eukprot:CAMPEP_0119037694 /NCGR_PEP_ID=MMETSP1177-20130426/6193_1 /TAXON_ID=2985 /ORGANISM="Ochromonas sp, Strain CCMP1899" /LENGTH=255 /DNA_ID=CAMNT_0006999311 /DNA_START=100 /DNA_END=867 /DNA_ORIENTATION=-